MADLGQFLPRSTGRLDVERARAYGESRAAYLSSMDQFYAGLEESQRQFDIQQELKEKEFKWQTEFEEEKFEQARKEFRKEFRLRKRESEARLELGERELELREEESEWERELAEKEFDINKYLTSLQAQLLRQELSQTGRQDPYRFRRGLAWRGARGYGGGQDTSELYRKAFGGDTNKIPERFYK